MRCPRIVARVGIVLAATTWLAAAGRGQTEARTTWSGVYSAAQAERGLDVYLATCAQCHGPDLSGIDAAPPLAGGRFASNWNGVTLGDMVDRIRVSMPQNNPGTLTRVQIIDVTAYLLQQNGFPAGDFDLPRQTSLLKTIAYESYPVGGSGGL